MLLRTLVVSIASLLLLCGRAICQVPHDSSHALVPCGDSPTPGFRPPNRPCAVLVHRLFDSLPSGRLVLRLETFADSERALRASTQASAVVRADGRIWLLTLAPAGGRSPGGHFVTEIGPVPVIPKARRYEMRVAQADFGPEVNTAVSNAVHTHSGPELWYLFTGEQCLETPDGTTRARAGEGMVAPAETPMRLTIVGPSKRDALFVVIHDAVRPATTVSDWRPTGACRE